MSDLDKLLTEIRTQRMKDGSLDVTNLSNRELAQKSFDLRIEAIDEIYKRANDF